MKYLSDGVSNDKETVQRYGCPKCFTVWSDALGSHIFIVYEPTEYDRKLKGKVCRRCRFK